MTPPLQHLDLIAAAPDGVKRLRELILELAVRGKLVPQNPKDEPASELLKRIQAEKVQLMAEGKIRKDKTLPAIGDDEKPFDLPDGWEWIRLGQIGDWGAGATPLRSSSLYYGGSMPWFKSGELTADFIYDSEEHVTEQALKECSLRINKVGDVLIAMYGATIGKAAILATTATTNQAVCACTPYSGVYNRYLLLLLKALKTNFVGQGAGGAQPNISREKIVATIAALPKEAEQHRIVAKVDELMALCDRLEAQQTEGHEAHATLVKTLLDTLTQPNPPPESAVPRPDRFPKPVRSGPDADSTPPTPVESAASFTDPWPRLAAHFDTLFTTEASIDALKQTILQLAVMGRLVPQNPDDEPAGELLKQIQAEKARLVAEGTIKRDKTLPAIGEDEKPFELPVGWEWVRLFDCSIQITDGEHATPPRTPDRTQVPLVTAKNVRDGYMDYLDTDFVEQSVAEKCWRRCKPEVGDILMVSVGATLGRLSVIVTPQDMVIVRSVTLIRPCLVSVQYISLALKSPLVQAGIWDVIKQMAQPCIYLAQSSCLLIPLPPLPEQHRIVAKVDELMALCDQLASQLKSAREVSGRYASAATSAALKAPCRPSNATLPPYSPLTSSIPQ